MAKKTTCSIIALLFILINSTAIFAQDNIKNPLYIVQPGENLYEIAAKFNISVEDLISINGIVNADLISAGTELLIPGLEGVTGVLTTTPVQIGETLPLVLKSHQITHENFLKLNKITSPSELFVGSTLILPSGKEDEQLSNNSVVINHTTSLFSQSISNGINTWLLKKENFKLSPIDIPGETFFFPTDTDSTISSPISPGIKKIEMSPLPVAQGHTYVIRLYPKYPVTLEGSLNGKTLRFFNDIEDDYIYALDGIHAMEEPGLIPLSIRGQFEDGESFQIEQLILLTSGGYVNEPLTVESTLIEENLIIEESKMIHSILETTSDIKYWNDIFRYPVDGSLKDDSIGFSSYFGNRRTYNNGQYYGFHGGLDFWVVLNSLNIYAPAPGTVIYTGHMDIRGNTTFIDHGQGVVSGYGHQSEILVDTGQNVETGDLIGLIGKTGRVTGPHLHWDIWVNGNQVDPFDWTNNSYP